MSARTSALLVFLVCVAGVEFTIRGPARWAMRGSQDRYTDFTGPYLATRAWVSGMNPYNPDIFWYLAEHAGWPIAAEERIDGYESRTPYPPTTFVLLAPLGFVGWATARLLGLGLTLAAIAGAVWGLARLPAWRDSQSRPYLFVALALALSPVHSSIAVGNPVALTAALVVIGVGAALRNEDTWAGVALACAACIKPPTAAPAIVFYLVTRRWRVVSVAVATTAAVLLVAVLRMQAAGVSWFRDYLFSNNILFAESGSAIVLGPVVHRQFIHLQYLGSMILGDARLANIVALTIGGVLLLTWLAVAGRRPSRRTELLDLSALIALSLLPFYHRVYDASLLLVPIVWLCIGLNPAPAWPRRAAALLMTPFFLPTVTFLEMQVDAHRIPDAVATAWWWNAIVMTHQVWALLFLSMTLLAAMVLSRREVDADRH